MQYGTHAMHTAAKVAALKLMVLLQQAFCGLQQLITAIMKTTCPTPKVAACLCRGQSCLYLAQNELESEFIIHCYYYL